MSPSDQNQAEHPGCLAPAPPLSLRTDSVAQQSGASLRASIWPLSLVPHRLPRSSCHCCVLNVQSTNRSCCPLCRDLLFASGRALRLAWWLCPCLFRRCKIARLPLLSFWCQWRWTQSLAEPACATSLRPAGVASMTPVVASPQLLVFLWVMAHASSAHVESWCPALYAADPRPDVSEQCQSKKNACQNVHVWQSVRGEQCAVTQRLEESVCQPPFRVPMRRP